MPGPPPPPPPAPTSIGNAKSAVLKDITKGTRLRKVPDTEKRDRSAPIVGSSSSNGNTSGSQGIGSGGPPSGNPFAEAALLAAGRKALGANKSKGIHSSTRPPPPSHTNLTNTGPPRHPGGLSNTGPIKPPGSYMPPGGAPPPPPSTAPSGSRRGGTPNRQIPNDSGRPQTQTGSAWGSSAKRDPLGNKGPLPSNTRPNPRPPTNSHTPGRTWQPNSQTSYNTKQGPAPSTVTSRTVPLQNSNVNAQPHNVSSRAQPSNNVTMKNPTGSRPLPAPPSLVSSLNQQFASQPRPQANQQPTRPLPPQPSRPAAQPPPPPTLPPPALPPSIPNMNRTAQPGTLVPDRGDNHLPLPPRNAVQGGTSRSTNQPPLPPPPPAPTKSQPPQSNGPISSHMYPEAASDFETRFRFPEQRHLPPPPPFMGGTRTYPSSKLRLHDAPPAMPPAPPPLPPQAMGHSRVK